MSDFHFIRPGWLWIMIPWMILMFYSARKEMRYHFASVCDKHLLPAVIHQKNKKRQYRLIYNFFISGLFIIISLAGPTWSYYEVPLYHRIQPVVFLLDMSATMLGQDVSPDRLSRAKFILHDLMKKSRGQVGLIAYTSEPFVVSPLTHDANTIMALLPALTVNIMPVQGNRLDLALLEAEKLIGQAGFKFGQIIVLTATAPQGIERQIGAQFAVRQIESSVIPLVKDIAPEFESFAQVARGRVLRFNSPELDSWFNSLDSLHQYVMSHNEETKIWYDQGRWFLIPSIILLLPVFRRGWLERMF